MPMFMDIHEAPGATADGVAAAHLADPDTHAKYGWSATKGLDQPIRVHAVQ
jgi:hypothetical protein